MAVNTASRLLTSSDYKRAPSSEPAKEKLRREYYLRLWTITDGHNSGNAPLEKLKEHKAVLQIHHGIDDKQRLAPAM